MGLIQSVIEKAGIPTVSISLIRAITEKIDPPRALFVDRPFGYPLGEPGNANLQQSILTAALDLLSADGELPLSARFHD